jgi:hypothetical protein
MNNNNNSNKKSFDKFYSKRSLVLLMPIRAYSSQNVFQKLMSKMIARILYCLDYYNHLFGCLESALNWIGPNVNLLFYNLYHTTVFIVQKSFIYNILKITSNICLFISFRKVGNRCSHLTSIRVYSHEF